MADYNPHRDARWNYGGKQWKLSRSKIDLFLQCPRCFYIDNKLGTKRTGFPSFMINNAVDHQLKQEFDVHRVKETQHPLQKEYGLDVVPAQHEKMDQWRENFEGVQCKHEPTGMIISGAIDDLWVKPLPSPPLGKGRGKEAESLSKGEGGLEHFVVDYKATASKQPVEELKKDSIYHDGYKRQMETYQWLLRKNKLKVSNMSYFVYCTGILDQKAFDGKIEFDVKVIPYEGDDSWVEPTILEIKKCLDGDQIPKSGENCEYCKFVEARKHHEEA